MIFSAAELINIVAGVLGGEGLGRITTQPDTGSRQWLRRVARRVDKATGDLVRDRKLLADLVADPTVWRAIAQRDEATLGPAVDGLAAAIVGDDDEERAANCRRVVEVLAAEVDASLTALERLTLHTHANTEQLIDDMGVLAYIGLDLQQRVGEVLEGQDAVLALARQQGRLDEAPALTGFAPALQPHVDRILAGALELHRQAGQAGDDDDDPIGEADPWLPPSFTATVFSTLLPDLKPVFGEVKAEELLLVHLVVLYVDAVLRVEASIRRHIFDPDRDGAAPDLSRVLLVDRARAESATPELVRRLARLDPADDQAVALRWWLVHQATLMSPSVWEGWAAHNLAAGLAALVEGREAKRRELADTIRQIGRHAAFDESRFPRTWRAVRLPNGGPSIDIRPEIVAAAARFSWIAHIDLRRVGLRLVEQVGLRTPFPLATALGDVADAMWTVAGEDAGERRMEIDASCCHPSVAQALFEHAETVAAEVARAPRPAVLPAFDDLRVGAGRVRAEQDGSGRDAFDLPLVQLELAQDEVRGLLMGTALYGHPELAIRELYQNALDACRYRRLRSLYLADVQPTVDDPRSAYQGEVTITQRRIGPDQMVIECVDNGVGMAHAEIRDSFAKAGKRFTDLASFQDEQARWLTLAPELRLHPNSRFGIGVFSYFMLADEIVIDTVRELPDGTLHAPLRVHVPAASGLLTITTPTTPPAEIAAGGTRVQLFISLGQDSGTVDDEVRTVSVLRLLEDLVWHTEVKLTVKEDDREPRPWEPNQLSDAAGGPATPAFEVEGCRAWWTQGRGGLLADGIKTDVDLEGVVVDLHATHAPALRADRNEVLSWDQPWVTTQLASAAASASLWNELTLAWMWRIAVHWPRVAQHIFETCLTSNPIIPLGAGHKPDTPMDLTEVGCFPYDAIFVGLDLGGPFPPVPPLLRRGYSTLDNPTIHWPDSIKGWRRAAGPWDTVATRQITPRTLATFPLADPMDAAMIGSPLPYQRHAGPGGTWHFATARVDALLVGIDRMGIDVSTALRRARRLHSAGVLAPGVDARTLVGVRSSGDAAWLASAMSGATSAPWGRQTLSLPDVLGAIVATAHHLGRPIGRFAPTLELLARLGMPNVPEVPPDVAARTLSRREATVLSANAHETFSWPVILSKAPNLGLRRYRDLYDLLRPFEDILRQADLDVGLLHQLADAKPTPEESIAWSQSGDGSAPFRFGGSTSVSHIVDVAQRLPCALGTAADLVLRCPGISIDDDERSRLDAMLADPLDLDLYEAFCRGPRIQRTLLRRRNALDLAGVAAKAGLDPATAAAQLRSVPWMLPYVPDVDWLAVAAFELTYVARELIMERDPTGDEVAPIAVAISGHRLTAAAATLRIDLGELAAVARGLSAIGVTCAFPAAVPDVGIPRDSDVEFLHQLTWQGWERALTTLIVELETTHSHWPAALRRLVPWLEWLVGDDQQRRALVEAVCRIDPPPGDTTIDSLAVQGVMLLEGIASGCGGVARAHVVEVCGCLGVRPTALAEAISLFEPALRAHGGPISWLPAPVSGDVPDWLDVAVVALLVARGTPTDDGDDPETLDFVVGNVEADSDEIGRRVRRWAPVLRTDPHAELIAEGQVLSQKDCVTGMVRWPIEVGVEGGR